MERLFLVALSLITLVVITASAIPMAMSAETSLPEDYPVNLFGDYIVLIENTTTFRDYLQPGDTDSYKIRIHCKVDL